METTTQQQAENKVVLFGTYEVTSGGEVYSHKRGTNRLLKGAVFRNKSGISGYRTVLLSDDGKAHNCYIHRLVAQAFVPNPHGMPCVKHINGDAYDNRAENLAWCTRKEALRCAQQRREAVEQEPTYCSKCGARLASARTKSCPSCKRQERLRQSRERKTARLQEELRGVSENQCTPLQYRAVTLRREGKTYQEIANEMNLSLQYVHQLVRIAEVDAQAQWDKPQPQYIARFHEAQRRRLARKQKLLQKALEEANKLSLELREYGIPRV